MIFKRSKCTGSISSTPEILHAKRLYDLQISIELSCYLMKWDEIRCSIKLIIFRNILNSF